jgi:hypothetical protein
VPQHRQAVSTGTNGDKGSRVCLQSMGATAVDDVNRLTTQGCHAQLTAPTHFTNVAQRPPNHALSALQCFDLLCPPDSSAQWEEASHSQVVIERVPEGWWASR